MAVAGVFIACIAINYVAFRDIETSTSVRPELVEGVSTGSTRT
jgi:hypothetical protein